MKMIESLCQACGILFHKRAKDYVNKKPKYCSIQCYKETQDKKIEISCFTCGTKILKQSYDISRYKNHFCSKKCAGVSKTISNGNKPYDSPTKQINCIYCNKEFIKKSCTIKQSGHYCSRSCLLKSQRKNRKIKHRSKSEKFLYQLIKDNYPNLEIIANDRQTFDGLEIDIWIPSIKLAIEWNGIYHFRPIFGQERLEYVQSKDKKKICLSQQLDINLVVIPDFSYFKPDFVKEKFYYLKNIIDKLLH